MINKSPFIMKRICFVSLLMLLLLFLAMILGISMGSTDYGIKAIWESLTGSGETDSMAYSII